ncbi:DUF885 domain-containing protein [Corallincola platygyrae]|uniref:DUF885 domain-containing protein n=1 Tax=Corallincola platygyrae TaxID=1193278 RepID=A0ABW4XSX2_9GAMM
MVALMACQPVEEEQVSPSGTPDEQVVALVDSYMQKRLSLDPLYAPYLGNFEYNHVLGNDLTEEYLKGRHELNSGYQDKAESIDRDSLSAARQLTLDIFLYDRQIDLVDETFPQRFMPLNQFYSRYSTFLQLGSGESAQPFRDETDYRAFMSRMDGFAAWVDSAISRMREGAESKVVLPKVLAERVIEQLDAQLVEGPTQSPLYGPLKNAPAGLSDAVKLEYEIKIAQVALPAFKRLRDFMVNEYIAQARGSDGMWDLPNGRLWYQHLSNVHTTTALPVNEIHFIGLREVERIRSEMNEVRERVGFEGTLEAFFEHLSSEPRFFFESSAGLVDGYEGLKGTINAVLPDYFDAMPATDYYVKAVEPYREKSAAGASYEPGAPDGSRPGIFYINTYNLKAQPKWGMTTLSLHEAAPGHHFQITIQQELESLPDYQRFSSATAFVEGWALYAEYLGVEMGLFEDPYQYFGKLSDEMLRAMRLVVDTGIHAKGWSREQAIQYMLDNSAMAETDVVAEVERYMAIPGQALSYKVGQLKIIELRQRAEKALGDKFDIKQFHNQVLLDGSLPLSVLEAKIDLWITSRAQASSL